MKFNRLRIILFFILFIFLSSEIFSVELRIKNIARFKGVRDNQLNGFGLVIGLKGTGDTKTTIFTTQAITNMLKNYGISDGPAQIRVRNVAAVMVTANLPPFAKKGSKVDVVVSSMGDARSLEGGVLLQTNLKGIDDNIYVIAQGPISTGPGNITVHPIVSLKNRATVGRVPGGGLVEREVPVTFVDEKNNMYLLLSIPDFTSAYKIADVINSQFWGEVANAVDAGTIKISVPFDFQNNYVEFAAAIEGLHVEIDERSEKVVINERTGTVVMGMDVSIDSCAVSHGNFNVNINVTRQISQPNPFLPGASAMVYERSNINVEGGGNQIVVLPQGANVQDLVDALNVLGASTQDIIAILQALRTANALHADIEIM